MTQATTSNSANPAAPRAGEPLLTPALMRQLDRLDVLSRKILAGKMQGERRSKKKGQSVEFADYRNYVVGDDLRFVDWNLYARLDKLFIRLFMEEEDLSVSVVLDVSRSMDYGEPNKLAAARRLAAAVGYIALSHYNRLSCFGVEDGVVGRIAGLRGRRPIPRLLDFLRAQGPGEPRPGDLAAACRQVALLQRTPGVVVLISDFFDKGDLAEALRYFAGDRVDAYAVQLLSPQEVDPVAGQLVGDLSLRDVEDGDLADVSITPALVKRYKANLEAYCEHVREQCLRRGVSYLMSRTDVPTEQLVLGYLWRRGMLG